jgi:hypothetical protein
MIQLSSAYGYISETKPSFLPSLLPIMPYLAQGIIIIIIVIVVANPDPTNPHIYI